MIGPELAHVSWTQHYLACYVSWLRGGLSFCPGGEKGTPLFICAAEQAMVFKVLSLKQGVQFQYEAS